MTAILRITDGTTTVDLVRGPYCINNWTPLVSGPKGGGSYSSSPLSDGQRLKSFVWDNVDETIDLQLQTSNQDAAIEQLQKLRRLLVKAKDYWTTRWQNEPVYIVARAPQETNTRYAIISQGRVDKDPNYYAQPFAQVAGPTRTFAVNLPLVLNRLHWQSEIPGDSECLPIYSQHNWQFSEWTVRDAGPVGTVYDIIEASTGTLIAADTSQIWRSTTGASGSWAARSFGGGHWDNDPGVIYSLCEDDQAYIYAACANGIFYSTDDGLNWTRQNAARGASTPNSLVWNIKYGALFLADYGNGIYYSTDDGANWTLNGLAAYGETNVNCLMVAEDYRMLAGIVTTYNYRIYMATGAALPVNWYSAYMTNPENIYSFYDAGDGYWYAGGSSGGLHRIEIPPSTATLTNWTLAVSGFTGTPYDFTQDGNGIYYLADTSSVWTSNDMLSWEETSVGAAGIFYTIIASDSKDEIYAGDPGDIWALAVLSEPLGREASTCDAEVYLANRHQFINYTHAYVYDASGPTWTRVFPSTALLFNLLPAVPAQNDAIYIGISTTILTTPSVLLNVVFDIGTPAKDLTILWEYYSGAGGIWRTLEITDNTLAGSQSLGLPGVNSIHFEEDGSNAWGTTNNGGSTDTGYWIRGRVTNVPAAPTTPTQQNREIYGAVWPYADIALSELTGDIETVLKLQISNEADKDGVGLDTDPAEYISGAYVAIHDADSKEDFPCYLNASSLQNQSGISVDLGLDTTQATLHLYPAGERSVYNPTGSDSMNPRVTFNISKGLASQFAGEYHAFVRCQEQGTPSNIGIRLRIRSGTGGQDFVTDTKYLYSDLDWNLLDFGQIRFTKSDMILSDETADEMFVAIECSAESNASDLIIYDLILLPTDGWLGYVDNRPFRSAGLIDHDNLFEIDSIDNPKQEIRAILKDDDEFFISTMLCDSNGAIRAIQNKDNRLWALFFCRHVDEGDDDSGGAGNSYLTDSAGDFVDDGVKAGDIVYNTTDGSQATITAVSATRIDGQLYGGTNNDWDNGDEYYIVTREITSRPWFVGRLQMWHVERYLAARGSR